MAIWRAFNKKTGAFASQQLPNVLAPVALTGVATTSGSNIVTVAATTGVYPFMGLCVPNLPLGAFVLAVKSATEIVAAASVLSTTTGEWTVTAANANASATATGMLGMALGCNPWPLAEAIADGEMWRNTVPNSYKTTTLKVQVATGVGTNKSYVDPGIMAGGVVPKEDAIFEGTFDASAIPLIKGAGGASDPGLTLAVSDEMIRKPYRTKTKWRLVHCLVHTGGDVTKIPAHPDISLERISDDA